VEEEGKEEDGLNGEDTDEELEDEDSVFEIMREAARVEME
jgi:hypothetical protein